MEQEKAQPYSFDLCHLLCNDPNPLPALPDAEKEAILANTARECAQGLINQLLTACPIERATDDGNLQINLPAPTTPLPREKPVPKEKEKTRWQKFADKKGIKPKKREGKLVYDETKGDWVPRYGYKGKDKGDAGDWMVEVDEKKERQMAEGGDGGKEGPKKKARKGK